MALIGFLGDRRDAGGYFFQPLTDNLVSSQVSLGHRAAVSLVGALNTAQPDIHDGVAGTDRQGLDADELVTGQCTDRGHEKYLFWK